MADAGSFFEIGPLWGTDQVAGFVRFNGHPVGVIASDSRHVNGGALTADGCDKLTRHLDVCDLFHLPVLNLVDNPGFAVGLEHEIAGTIRQGGEWMVAFAQVTVPIFTVLMRRSFGVAGNNYATPRSRPSCAWPGRRPTSAASRPRAASRRPTSASSPRRPTRGPARRDQRPHRERARADRAAQPLPDRGDDRPARHAPLSPAKGADAWRLVSQPVTWRRGCFSSGLSLCSGRGVRSSAVSAPLRSPRRRSPGCMHCQRKSDFPAFPVFPTESVVLRPDRATRDWSELYARELTGGPAGAVPRSAGTVSPRPTRMSSDQR